MGMVGWSGRRRLTTSEVRLFVLCSGLIDFPDQRSTPYASGTASGIKSRVSDVAGVGNGLHKRCLVRRDSGCLGQSTMLSACASGSNRVWEGVRMGSPA